MAKSSLYICLLVKQVDCSTASDILLAKRHSRKYSLPNSTSLTTGVNEIASLTYILTE